MKISTKGRYALRLIIELAKAPAGVPVRLRELAEKQEISDSDCSRLRFPDSLHDSLCRYTPSSSQTYGGRIRRSEIRLRPSGGRHHCERA